MKRMKDEKKCLRQRFKNAIALLQKGCFLAKKLFFSDKKSAVCEPLKTEILEAEEKGEDMLKLDSVIEISRPELDVKNEDTKAARRFKDRVNKFNAAQRDLKKAEDRYNAQLVRKVIDTSHKHVSRSTVSKYDAEITKLYRKMEEARRKVKIAEKKLIRDKNRYEKEL